LILWSLQDARCGHDDQSRIQQMKAVLCPTCGCSLVRLKVSRDQAALRSHGGVDYHFCCNGCAERFPSDPERYLAQIRDVVVCPACLGEKPAGVTIPVEHSGKTLNFCGCPHCEEVFTREPDRLLRAWRIGKARCPSRDTISS
jgi:YHS domain-containing protein